MSLPNSQSGFVDSRPQAAQRLFHAATKDSAADIASPSSEETLQRKRVTNEEFIQRAIAAINASRQNHMKMRDVRVGAISNKDRLARERVEIMSQVENSFSVNSVDALRSTIMSMRGAITQEVVDYKSQVDHVVENVQAAMLALGDVAL